MVEMALLGIPMLFVWISITEMGRAMWQFQVLQHATKTTGSYLAVHGSKCGIPPNTCTLKVSDVVAFFSAQAPGIDVDRVSLTFTSASGTTVGCVPLSSCTASATLWPPNSPRTNPDNIPGKDVVVRARYRFGSALALVAPGAGTVAFGTFNMVASTRQSILF